jgi:hypothetical protein
LIGARSDFMGSTRLFQDCVNAYLSVLQGAPSDEHYAIPTLA